MSPEDKDKLNALFGHAVEQQEMAKTAISEMAKERAQLNKGYGKDCFVNE